MTQRPDTSPSPFQVWDHTKKHIVFVDALGFPDILPDLRRLSATGCPVEFHVIGDGADNLLAPAADDIFPVKHLWPDADASDVRDRDRLDTYLANQLMGTHLYIAASWRNIRRVLQATEMAGYAPEDIQTRGYGPEYHQVFCIGCYTLNPIESPSTTESVNGSVNGSTDEPENVSVNLSTNPSIVTCQNCGRRLSVSDHYSRRLDAVLGSIELRDF